MGCVDCGAGVVIGSLHDRAAVTTTASTAARGQPDALRERSGDARMFCVLVSS